MSSLKTQLYDRLRLFAVAVLFWLVVIAGMSWLESHRGPDQYDLVRRDLRQIANALQAFEGTHDRMPLAGTTGNDDTIQSWRVEILPYFERDDSFPNFDLNVSWNDAANRPYVDHIVDLYRSPRAPEDRPLETSYVAIVGPGFVWEEGKTVRPKDIKDAATILLVEVRESGIDWMEPKDFTFGEFMEYLTRQQTETFHGFYALLANGGVTFVSRERSRDQLHALFTVDGGEKVDW